MEPKPETRWCGECQAYQLICPRCGEHFCGEPEEVYCPMCIIDAIDEANEGLD